MGNCCMKKSSSMVWGGEDWGSMGRVGPDPDHDDVKKGLLGGGGPSAGAELRIKISKKQLVELLKRAEETGGGGVWARTRKEAAAAKVLERLIERSVKVEVRRPSWRPKLQSIPEYD